MRKLIVQELVTVDGFLSGPEGELDFMEAVSDYTEVDQYNLAVLSEVDEVLLGRRTYEMFAAYWPTAEQETVAPVVNTMPKTVFSSTLDSVSWGSWNTVRLERGDPAAEVTRLKRQSGGHLMLWGSIALARTLMRHGLVDEYQFHILPVAIGRGVGLVEPDEDPINLDLTGIRDYRSGIATLTYVPRGSAAGR